MFLEFIFHLILFFSFKTQDIMDDPYILVATGVSYDRAQIEQWIRTRG